MTSETKMNRSSAARQKAADKHDRSNPFCAAHPDLSVHRSAAIEPDVDDNRVFRQREDAEPHAHVRAEHVTVTKKRK